MTKQQYRKMVLGLGFALSLQAAAEPFIGPFPGGPGRPGLGSRETQRALNQLGRAQRFVTTLQFRNAVIELRDARRSLVMVGRDRDIRDAIRAIEDAEDTLLRARVSDGARVVFRALQMIRDAERLIQNSDAHCGRGGNGGRRQIVCEAFPVNSGPFPGFGGGPRGRYRAQGFDERRVRDQALDACERDHRRCDVDCREIR